MAGTHVFTIVYNNGNDTFEVDPDSGQLLAPRDWACVRRSKVSEALAAGSLVPVNPDTIVENMSNPLAWAAKQAYDKAVAEYDAANTDQAEPQPDYDKSTEETASKTTSRTKK